MSTLHQGWYDKNAARQYPLDETASGIDNRGNSVPTHILSDLRVHFPRSLGQYAFLGALSLSDRLVSLVLLAADDPDAASTYVPLAALSLPRTADVGRMYALTPMTPGAAGWAVFGPALRDALNYRGEFSSPAQSRLLARACRHYRDVPIASVGKLGNQTALTGLVRLRGGADIEVVSDCRVLPGFNPSSDTSRCDDAEARNCIVVRLKNNPAESQSLLRKYVGPCGRRPESGTCLDPQPVETISGVGPDADGVITIEFRGAATLAEIVEEVVLDADGQVVTSADAVGVLLDSPLGLADTCGTQRELPTLDGRLPTELQEECEVSSILLPDPTTTTGDGECVVPAFTALPRFDAAAFNAARVEIDARPVLSYFDGAVNPLGWSLTGDWTRGDTWKSGAMNPFKHEPTADARPLITAGYDYAEAVYQDHVTPPYRRYSVLCTVVGNARLMFGYGDDGSYHFVEVYLAGNNPDYAAAGFGNPGLYYGWRDAGGTDHVFVTDENLLQSAVAGSLIRLSASVWPDPDVAVDAPGYLYTYATAEVLRRPTTEDLNQREGAGGTWLGVGGRTQCLTSALSLAGVASTFSNTVFYEFSIGPVQYPGT